MWHRFRLESRKGWSHECLPLFHWHISFVGTFPFLWCGVPHHRQRVNTPAPPGSKWCEMERGRSDSPRTPSGSKGVESEAVIPSRCLFDDYGLAHGTDDGLGNDGKHFRTPDPREQIRTGFERLGLGGPIRFEGDGETNLAGIRDLDNPHGILLGSLLSNQGLTQPFQRT